MNISDFRALVEQRRSILTRTLQGAYGRRGLGDASKG